MSNPLPSNFSKNFLFIGNTNEIDYLQENKYVKIITEKSFPFAKEKIIIYEVLFDEISGVTGSGSLSASDVVSRSNHSWYRVEIILDNSQGAAYSTPLFIALQ